MVGGLAVGTGIDTRTKRRSSGGGSEDVRVGRTTVTWLHHKACACPPAGVGTDESEDGKGKISLMARFTTKENG